MQSKFQFECRKNTIHENKIFFKNNFQRIDKINIQSVNVTSKLLTAKNFGNVN